MLKFLMVILLNKNFKKVSTTDTSTLFQNDSYAKRVAVSMLQKLNQLEEISVIHKRNFDTFLHNIQLNKNII